MFHAIRTRINATSVVAVLALVFAMTGGAYAAKKYLITSTRQISPSVLKSLKGTKGASGAPGAGGAQGAQGPAGVAGAAGAKGDKGDAGAQGLEGKEGKEGKEGSPWTAAGKLPAASSETGVFSPPKVPVVFGSFPVPGDMEPGEYLLPVSFSIPLSSAPEFVAVPSEGEAFGSAPGCPGVAGGIPKAASGKFCVYIAGDGLGLEAENASVSAFRPDGALSSPGAAGAGRSGAMLRFSCTAEVVCTAAGLWAVTG